MVFIRPLISKLLLSYSFEFFFFTRAFAEVFFQWTSKDSESFQIFSILLSILADLSNSVVWQVSTVPPISISSSPLTKPLWTVPSALFITGITTTFMFHKFLVFWQSLNNSLSFHLFWSVRTTKFFNFFFFFFWYLFRSGRLAWIRWSDYISNSLGNLCLILLEEFSFAHAPFVSMINFNLLHNSKWITYIPFVLVCCIRLLCGQSFRLYHLITYTFYSVTLI